MTIVRATRATPTAKCSPRSSTTVPGTPSNSSCSPLASPRMVALDEAFAGIDDTFKPELLGLTVKFDLDLFMTGHDLWVRYPTVPLIAHYDMQHDKAAHTLSTLLALWDGEQLLDAGAGFAGNEELA